jgi:hypothetical protein
MMKTPRRKFRLCVPETLEDRAVPSAAPLVPTIDVKIENTYTVFASEVEQAEANYFGPSVAQFTLASKLAMLSFSINNAMTNLEQNVVTSLSGTIGNTALSVIEPQINGSAAGSLVSGMNAILDAFAAAAPNGGTPGPLLLAAINGEVSSSFNSTFIEASVYPLIYNGTSDLTVNPFASPAGDISVTPIQPSLPYFNLDQYTAQANDAYGSTASTISLAESTLYLYPTLGGDPTAADELQAIIAAAGVKSVTDAQIAGLSHSLGSLIISTGAYPYTGLFETQITGNGPGTLLTQVNSLFGAAASSDGAISVNNLGLLTAAIDSAIAASYESSAVDAYLLTTP